jgi:hypothetical protein
MAGDSPQPVTLDRNELGALLVAAVPGPPSQPALVSLLALNGLRVPETAGARPSPTLQMCRTARLTANIAAVVMR